MPAPDWLADLKTWLIADVTLAPLHGGRVYFRIPATPTFPLIRLYAAGGGAESRGGEPVLYTVRAGLEIWGDTDPMYDQVRGLKTALETVLNDAVPQPLGATTWLHSALVTGSVDSPDPDTGWPRYVTTAGLTVSHT